MSDESPLSKASALRKKFSKFSSSSNENF